MKNPSSGDISIMSNSIKAGQTISTYIIGEEVYNTKGNNLTHGVLRGGSSGPNYSLENISKTYQNNIKNKIHNPGLIIDCNHSNSGKKFEKQVKIMEEVIESISSNNDLKKFVKGFMIESYLYNGRQDFENIETVKKGLSLTDPCVGKEGTIELIEKLYKLIK
ncbi:MAG: hypothetical protein Q9M97_09295 [Candidatus Gracilibacteria bacterium]|nr:hypothetical protein [Candidatus Gracilibacteria bacterium]